MPSMAQRLDTDYRADISASQTLEETEDLPPTGTSFRCTPNVYIAFVQI